MLKILKKKYIKKKFLEKIYFFYKKYLIENYFLKKTSLYQLSIENFVPKKQHYLKINDSLNIYIYSSGFILKKLQINLKYYKKSTKSNASTILYIQRVFFSKIKYIYFYRCLNFTIRQWIFLQKFYKLINPNIFLFQHKKSYNVNYSPKKRIKKRIVKLLNK